MHIFMMSTCHDFLSQTDDSTKLLQLLLLVGPPVYNNGMGGRRPCVFTLFFFPLFYYYLPWNQTVDQDRKWGRTTITKKKLRPNFS